MVNSGLKMYTCKLPKQTEQCIGVLKMSNNEKTLISSNSLNGQRFVAVDAQVPKNNYNKMNEEQLKTLHYYKNYQRGTPSKVSI